MVSVDYKHHVYFDILVLGVYLCLSTDAEMTCVVLCTSTSGSLGECVLVSSKDSVR